MLEVLNQGRLAEEIISREGVTEMVHVVVKNSPFTLLLRVGQDPSIEQWQQNNSNMTVECKLFYDTHPPKEVDYLFSSPIDYKVLPCDQRATVSLEIRPKILSTQREDMLFRILVQLLDSATGLPVTGMNCFSHPIKILSKTDQIKKPKKDYASSLPQTHIFLATARAPQNHLQILAQNKRSRTRCSGHALALSTDRSQRPVISPLGSGQDVPLDSPTSINTLLDKLLKIEDEEKSQFAVLSTLVPSGSSYHSSSSAPTEKTDLLSPISSVIASSASGNGPSSFRETNESFAFIKSPDEQKRYKSDHSPGSFSRPGSQFSSALSNVCRGFKETEPEQRAMLIEHLLISLGDNELNLLTDLISSLDATGLRGSNLTFDSFDYNIF